MKVFHWFKYSLSDIFLLIIQTVCLKPLECYVTNSSVYFSAAPLNSPPLNNNEIIPLHSILSPILMVHHQFWLVLNLVSSSSYFFSFK